MLSLPEKPWKRVRLSPAGEGRYVLTFVAGITDEADFREVLQEDVEACLRGGDRLAERDWASRSVTLLTQDLQHFLRNLALHSIMVVKDG